MLKIQFLLIALGIVTTLTWARPQRQKARSMNKNRGHWAIQRANDGLIAYSSPGQSVNTCDEALNCLKFTIVDDTCDASQKRTVCVTLSNESGQCLLASGSAGTFDTVSHTCLGQDGGKTENWDGTNKVYCTDLAPGEKFLFGFKNGNPPYSETITRDFDIGNGNYDSDVTVQCQSKTSICQGNNDKEMTISFTMPQCPTTSSSSDTCSAGSIAPSNPGNVKTCEDQAKCLQVILGDCNGGQRSVCIEWKPSTECAKEYDNIISHVCPVGSTKTNDWKPCNRICHENVKCSDTGLSFGVKDARLNAGETTNAAVDYNVPLHGCKSDLSVTKVTMKCTQGAGQVCNQAGGQDSENRWEVTIPDACKCSSCS